MAFNPSPSQALALKIDYHKNMLVSAGAGSGKTAVLSERIKDIILTGVNPTNLLVLTFTKDAAAEMKDRVKQKLIDVGLENMLPSLEQAYFTTFDSYSLSICKKYSYIFGIGQDIGIADDAAIYGTKVKIINEIFNEYLANDNQVFKSYLKYYTNKSLDSSVTTLLDYISALDLLPDTIDYLNNLEANVLNDQYIERIKESYNKYLLELANKLLIKLSKLLDIISQPDNREYIEKTLLELENEKDLDKFIEIFGSFNLPGRNSGAYALDSVQKKTVESVKDAIKSYSKDKVKMREFIDTDLPENYQYIKLFRDIILEYYKRLNEFKRQMNIYEYVDISKMVIKLVRTNPTIKEELKNQYHEILIDEYQDTSDLQEAFISEIANNNLFMVGDIKQSIYRFRHANPMIFKEKYEKYDKLYAETDCIDWQERNNKIDYNSSLGLRIDMKENFRSRSEVLEDIRTIFNPLMTSDFGDAEFEANHQMTYGNKSYDKNIENNRDYHMKLLRYDPYDPLAEEYKKDELEAFIVADDILKRLKSHQMVMNKDGKSMRELKPNDICIICDRGIYFETIEAILQKNGIPVSINKNEDINSCDNVAVIISLIKLVSLSYSKNKEELKNEAAYWHAVASIYRSFLFKDRYTDTDIFNIVKGRVIDNEVSQKGFEVASLIDRFSNAQVYNQMIETFNYFNQLTHTQDINKRMHEVEYIFNNIVSLSKMGNHFTDISTYLSDALDSDLKLSYALDHSDDPGVKIMNIHKSKGLEFAICYFLDYDHKPNETDYKKKYGFNKDLGLYLTSFVNKDEMFEKEAGQRDTVQAELSNYYGKKENNSERVRLFYVALTRAREEIVIVYPKDRIDPSNLVHNELKTFNNYLTYISTKTYLNIRDVDFNKIKLTHNYHNNDININLKSNEEYQYNKLSINYNVEEKSKISKAVTKIMDNKELDNLELGTNVHEVMESIDFKNPDLSNLNIDDNTKKLVKMALDNPLFKNASKAKAYKELEFKFNYNNKSYNGIIDLLLVYSDRVEIIDYKLSNIDSEEYVRQLSIYKKFVESKTNLPISCFLYSLAKGVSKKVECIENF